MFVFFKQKTAYEMRISDWSSDVCSSDLVNARAFIAAMLRPHDRENAKLRQVGLATQRLQYAGIFFFIETMVGNDLRSDGGCALGHAHALSRGGRVRLD